MSISTSASESAAGKSSRSTSLTKNLADDASTQSLFLVPNADACPAGTTAPGVLGIDVQLARPLQEVSCETIGRVETEVVGCN
jgi:hypothetical protein